MTTGRRRADLARAHEALANNVAVDGVTHAKLQREHERAHYRITVLEAEARKRGEERTELVCLVRALAGALEHSAGWDDGWRERIEKWV
jgi:hypothetical protein